MKENDIEINVVIFRLYLRGSGRVFRDTGIYSIYLKGYGILLKILNGILGIYGYKGF